MKQLICIIVLFLSIQSLSFSQEEVNNYKYVVVPNQFNFLNEPDKYQLNSLLTFLFDKYGYTAFMKGNDLPVDLRQNPCLGLIAELDEVKGGFLKTKVQISLLDCNDQVVYKSQIGESRIKDFSKAYHAAVRQAFETFQNFDYDYEPLEEMVSSSVVHTNKSPVDEVKAAAEIEKLKKLEPQESNTGDDSKLIGVFDKGLETNSVKPQGTIASLLNKPLYVQPMDNGLQIVDTEPKKVMFLLKTSLTDVYNVEGKDALVYKKNGQWIYESQDPDSPKKLVIDLRF